MSTLNPVRRLRRIPDTTGLQQLLQTGAARLTARSEENTTVLAACNDIGDPLANFNHGISLQHPQTFVFPGKSVMVEKTRDFQGLLFFPYTGGRHWNILRTSSVTAYCESPRSHDANPPRRGITRPNDSRSSNRCCAGLQAEAINHKAVSEAEGSSPLPGADSCQ